MSTSSVGACSQVSTVSTSVTKMSRGPDRPTLVVDQIGQYHAQVVNQWRRDRLGVKVSPGDGGTVQQAETLDGIIREIEYCSMAHIAYDTAFDNAVSNGWGFWRILTEYVDDRGFDQELVIRP